MPKPTFEECLKHLEDAVTQLEERELSLEASLKLFEEGIEASKQCGRTTLMEVSSVLPFGSAVLAGDANATRMMASAEPDAVPLHEFERRLAPGKPVFALIGPEGGFTPEEVALARDTGYSVVSLGPRILRAETAGVAAVTAMLYELGDLG